MAWVMIASSSGVGAAFWLLPVVTVGESNPLSALLRSAAACTIGGCTFVSPPPVAQVPWLSGLNPRAQKTAQLRVMANDTKPREASVRHGCRMDSGRAVLTGIVLFVEHKRPLVRQLALPCVLSDTSNQSFES